MAELRALRHAPPHQTAWRYRRSYRRGSDLVACAGKALRRLAGRSQINALQESERRGCFGPRPCRRGVRRETPPRRQGLQTSHGQSERDAPSGPPANNGHPFGCPLGERTKTSAFSGNHDTGILCVGSLMEKAARPLSRQVRKTLKSGPMGRRRPPHILTPVKAAGLHYANACQPRSRPNRLLTLGPVIYFANVDPAAPHRDIQAF